MFPTVRRLLATPSTPPPQPYRSPFRAKTSWPPDFSQLTPKHQFRFERRYRRRAKLKYARPGWMKATKLMQYGAIGFVLTYGVLFMDWERSTNPFQSVREWFWGTADKVAPEHASHPVRPGPRSDPSRPPG